MLHHHILCHLGARLEAFGGFIHCSFYGAQVGLGVAVEYALNLGLLQIWDRISSLAAIMRRRLQEVPGLELHDKGRQLCGIVSFSLVRFALSGLSKAEMWSRKLCLHIWWKRHKRELPSSSSLVMADRSPRCAVYEHALILACDAPAIGRPCVVQYLSLLAFAFSALVISHCVSISSYLVASWSFKSTDGQPLTWLHSDCLTRICWIANAWE